MGHFIFSHDLYFLILDVWSHTILGILHTSSMCEHLKWGLVLRGVWGVKWRGGAGDVFQSLPLLDGNGWNVRQSAVVIPVVNF